MTFNRCALTAGLAGALSLAAPLRAADAPALSLRTLNGGAFDLAAERGHVVLVNFWATWCPPCREEIPALNAFYRRYHGKGLEIIGVSADAARDREAVVKMSASIAYPVAVIKDASVNGFGSTHGLPVTYVIDARGALRAEMRPDSAPVNAQSLEATVVPLLGGK